MKRTLNRILALGMAICMLLSLVVVQASAATTTDGLQSQISAAAGSSVQIVLDGDVTLDQTIQIPAKTAVTITTDGAARTVKRGEGLQFIFTQQSKIAVIRQAQPLQKGIDPIAAGSLFAIFQSGKGHRFTDSIAKLLLGQAQIQPPLFDIFSKKNIFH